MTETESSEARRVERAYLSPEITHQRLRTLDALAVQPGESILDAGCGPGLLAAELARLTGPSGRVLAVDKSADMLDLAGARCHGMQQVEFRQAAIERLDDADASFDVTVCTQVLLYVEDVAAALAQMHRLMRPGGRIAVVETDWRGCVLSTGDADLTEVMI